MLDPGTKLGAFEITAQLGKGGMGEVYRARDTKLGRDVAIKILPEALACDAEYLKRFKKEAKTLASLDHPNIAAIYDFVTAETTVGEGEAPAEPPDAFGEDSARQGFPSPTKQAIHLLVMQLVEGEPLSARIRRGALSVREALPIFIQIARGLDAAHEKGIVHRDLKPANITLTTTGDAKVLDFGIAKDMTQAEVDPNAATTPMTSSPVTGAGTLVGTPHYMSPEQARGRPVDRRTDVWAFGCCLYEALTGIRPYDGETMTDVVTGIIHNDPEWSPLPSNLPRELDRLLHRCLDKELRRRPSSMNDIAIILEDVLTDLRDGRLSTPLGAAPGVGGSSAPIRSLVVLPLENLMGDPAQEYFVDGMTDALSAELSKIKALKVVSRGSAMRYKGSKKPLTDIARELGVEGLVEGSIFRSGNEVRITAQLIDGRSDEHVWAENYHGAMEGILGLQSDVALAIARAVRVAVSPDEEKRIQKSALVNAEAYDCILKATHSMASASPEAMKQRIALIEEALAIEPDFAPAHAALSLAYWLPSIEGTQLPRAILPRAQRAAEQALRLDPDLPLAHLSRGYVALLDKDWATAKRHVERCMELDPNYVEGLGALGTLRIIEGELHESVAAFERAVEIDPMSAHAEQMLGVGLLMNRLDFDAALSHTRRSLELAEDSVLGLTDLAIFSSIAGRIEDAMDAANRLRKLTENSAHARVVRAFVLSKRGEKREALALLEAVVAQRTESYCSATMLSVVYSNLGMMDESFKWLFEAIEEREWYSIWFCVMPGHDIQRVDPRFEEAMERAKLPEKVRQISRERAQAIRARTTEPAARSGAEPWETPSSPAVPQKSGVSRRRSSVMIAIGAVFGLISGFVLFGGPHLPANAPATDSIAVGTSADDRSSKKVRQYPLALPDDLPLAPAILFDSPAAVSPDGQTIVYTSLAQQGRVLVRHNRGELDFQIVTGSEGASYPAFSPDGAQLAFLKENGLYRLPAAGGSPVRLADTTIYARLEWADDDYIYFTQSNQSGICRVKSAGGTVESITSLRDDEVIHAWADTVPGQQKLIYGAYTAFGPENGTVVVRDLKSGEEKTLVERAGAGYYLPTGHLLYVEGERLVARKYDWAEMTFLGPAVDVTPARMAGSGRVPTRWRHSLSGTLVYVPDQPSVFNRFVWTDLSGNEESIPMPPGEYFYGRISPEGQRIVYSTHSGTQSDVWVYDLALETALRLTFSPDIDVDPVWSAGGSQLLIGSARCEFNWLVQRPVLEGLRQGFGNLTSFVVGC